MRTKTVITIAAQSGYYLVNLKSSEKPYRAFKILVY
jgi:hypothetical protein